MDEKQTKQNGPAGKKLGFPAAAVFFLLLLMSAFLIAGLSGAFGRKAAASSASSGGAGISGAAASPPAAGAVSSGAGASGGTASASDGYVLPAASAASVPFSPDAGAQAKTSSVPDSEPQSAASGTTLKEKYGLLSDGMTYAQAQAVCGSGTLVTEVGGTQVYEWRGPDPDGSFLRATFKDGKLTRKYQFGL